MREPHPPCSATTAVAAALGGDTVAASERRAGPAREASARAASPDRFRAIVDRHYDFLWRTVRYLGVPDAAAEDALQQVLCVVARRFDEIASGAEISFLFSTAVRVASEWRRTDRRHPSIPVEDVDEFVGPCPTPEELVDTRRAQEVLREIVEAMPVELRMVFILCEIEELTLAEAAECLGIPAGTATSRLRRAREKFKVLVRRRVAFPTPTNGEGR
ncbi:MAG TPA: sigma-70 family RNA polymerase sigma factor [Polyangiaceae bacterium]|nr:sigma-70 family RNA polymerase sigma factor [Polyangiaceae bacterium]